MIPTFGWASLFHETKPRIPNMNWFNINTCIWVNGEIPKKVGSIEEGHPVNYIFRRPSAWHIPLSPFLCSLNFSLRSSLRLFSFSLMSVPIIGEFSNCQSLRRHGSAMAKKKSCRDTGRTEWALRPPISTKVSLPSSKNGTWENFIIAAFFRRPRI